MNKFLYLFFIVGGNICTLFFTMLASEPRTQEMWAAVPIPIVLTAAFQLTMIYRMWSAIQSSRPRTTPGKAIGLLFIPVYNLYWIFQVFGGYATDFNTHLKRERLSTRPMSVGLLTAYAAACLVAVPVVSWIVQALAIVHICNRVNALKSAHRAQEPRRAMQLA